MITWWSFCVYSSLTYHCKSLIRVTLTKVRCTFDCNSSLLYVSTTPRFASTTFKRICFSASTFFCPCVEIAGYYFGTHHWTFIASCNVPAVVIFHLDAEHALRFPVAILRKMALFSTLAVETRSVLEAGAGFRNVAWLAALRQLTLFSYSADRLVYVLCLLESPFLLLR